ncbi:MAG: transglutaminase domain-containing protein, partial [Phycisphaerae bacterium]|nr:transglutaminase domain-containing protein [Phycisphaerae bacterium]
MRALDWPMVLGVLFLLAASVAWAGDIVRTPRLTSEHVVDCSTIESIVAGVIKPEMTPRQKAEAVYEFVRQYRWHWTPAREGDRRDDYEYGVVSDPVKLLNVYGYGYCFQTGPLLEALYQAVGLEARVFGISGHTICEVYYEIAYHYYDSDQH